MHHQFILDFILSDSDDDTDPEPQTKHRRLNNGAYKKRRYIDRDFTDGQQSIYLDYLSVNPIFTEEKFKRRFRISKCIFLKLVEWIQEYDSYFVQSSNSSGKIGISAAQKLTAVLRVLATGCA